LFGDGRHREPVSDCDLNIAIARITSGQLLAGFIVKLPPEVRPQQVFVLVARSRPEFAQLPTPHRLHSESSVEIQFITHRVSRSRVRLAQIQLRSCSIRRPCTPYQHSRRRTRPDALNEVGPLPARQSSIAPLQHVGHSGDLFERCFEPVHQLPARRRIK
jgi:hypothetical protein